MRPPEFWYRPPGILSSLLSPLGALYAAGTKRRLARGARAKVGVPVICIGNINAGGTGKTPTVIATVQALCELGKSPQVITRGYGGSLDGPVKVDVASHTADEVGDEPLIIAPFAPVWVAKDRASGARAAVADGANVIVLDDGFQNPCLTYDLSIVVVDAARGFGNGHVLPAGPLREPVQVGLARADSVLSIGPLAAQKRFSDAVHVPKDLTHLRAKMEPVETGMDWPDTRVFAFAGIGDPEKFFATLRGLGADLVGTRALDDHQKLARPLLVRIKAEADALGAQLVTTEKDAVRVPSDLRPEILSLPGRMSFDAEDDFQSLLKTVL